MTLARVAESTERRACQQNSEFLRITTLNASIDDYKNTRETLIKDLAASTNILDWCAGFNDNMQLGAKFSARSLEVDVLTSKDKEILSKIYDFVDVRENSRKHIAEKKQHG